MAKSRQRKHPERVLQQQRKRAMTPAWKDRVLRALAANKRAGATPCNLAQLAEAIGADKRGLYVTFDTDQLTSQYVDAIIDLLPVVGEPTVDANPEPDPLETEIALVRQLPKDKQDLALRLLRSLTQPEE